MKTRKKNLKQLLKEIEDEIKITRQCEKKAAKKGDYAEALDYKRSAGTLEFVLELASGRLG